MAEAHAGTLLIAINSAPESGPAKAGHYVPCPGKAGHYVPDPAKAGHVRSSGPAGAGHYVRWVVALVATTVLVSACASSGRNPVPPGTAQPDQYLFEKGNAAIAKKKWLTAREYYKQVTETYTQSPLRPDAKLGIGDTYLGEGSTEALVLAIGEFQEFLSFYPTNKRADYAQYKLGIAHFRQMRAPQRDQSETRDALKEFQTFLTRYPSSELMPEVKARLRETRDRLSESELEVGRFYFRIRWYPGALDRLNSLLKDDPEFTSRDEAYFIMGESLMKLNRPNEALPWFDKIVTEFGKSERLEEAKKRVEEIKNPPAPAAAKANVKTSS
jgi:outer membrane protein assembly factor BamD